MSSINAKRQRVIRKVNARQKGKHTVKVFRSNKHIYAQLADPSGKILCGVSTLSKSIKTKVKNTGNKEAAKAVGLALAVHIKKLKLTKSVAFNRSGYLYHGRVAKVAEGMRESDINI